MPLQPCALSTSTEPSRHSARSLHAGGVNAAMMDGSARFFSNDVNLTAWRAMGTSQGAEVFEGRRMIALGRNGNENHSPFLPRRKSMRYPVSGLLGLAVLLATIASGCGPGNPLGRKAVSGTVTLNGAPLPAGSIMFEPQGSQARWAARP